MLGLSSLSAEATLIGDQVTVTNLFGGNLSQGPTTVTVGAGTELFNFGDGWDIDIASESIRLTCSGGSGCDGTPNTAIDSYLFGDLDWVGMSGALVGVALDPLSTAAVAVANSSLSFTPNSVRIDFGTQITGTQGQFVLINLQTRHVPEPATLGLLGLGLGGLAVTRRRRSV